MNDPRRRIPSVDRLLAEEAFRHLAARTPRSVLLRAIREVQEELRAGLGRSAEAPPHLEDVSWYAERAERRVEELLESSLRSVINATGVVLHTNLGRAPLAQAAVDSVLRVARGYTTLEYDLESGGRGSREDHCAGLLRELTGAEATLVVNNNAGAVLLALSTLAPGRDAVISRGELVEIGGSFRVPEIMARSGARMVEVGATNRTHLSDYEAAFSEGTGVVLKVHRSNFTIRGFTAEAEPARLAELCQSRGVPLLHDLGSGLLMDLTRLGLPPEPTLREALSAGADVVTASGDKALGGPQAGILLGRAELIEAMRRNPLRRALRVDKLTLAALEATLALYRDEERALREIPTLRMLALGAEEIGARARALGERLRETGVATDVVDGTSAVGGGTYPEAKLPTRLLAVASSTRPPPEVERRLRAGDPPVIARVVEDRVVLDLRTVAPGEEDALIAAVRRAAE